jgi:hypothetical protein
LREKGNFRQTAFIQAKISGQEHQSRLGQIDRRGNCEWYFKAVFADGEESKPATYDFCEDNLELVFD